MIGGPARRRLTSFFIADPINRSGRIVRDQQRAIGHDEDIDGASPSPVSLQPAFGESLIGNRSVTLELDDGDTITDWDAPVP